MSIDPPRPPTSPVAGGGARAPDADAAPAPEVPDSSTSGILDDALALLAAARPTAGALLDAPCGSGYLATRASAAGWRVTACDIDPSLYRGPATVPVSAADLSDALPFPDASFDAVVCCEGIEHLDNPWRALRQFRRVLRPGGDLVVSLPNTIDVRQRWRHFRRGALGHYVPSHPSHVNTMGPVVLAHALLTTGFAVIGARGACAPYGGLGMRCLAPLFRISRRAGLPDGVRAMLSTSTLLCSRTVILHARAVAAG